MPNEKTRTKPAHFHPDLTPDRIDLLATLIALIQDDALGDLQEDKGDSEWVLGCCGFERCRAAIQKLANEKKIPWLTVVDPSMHFVFRIGTVIVRFCRGDEEGTPNGNALTRVNEETALYKQIYLDGFFDPDYSDCVWRYVVVKGPGQKVQRVEFKLVRSDNNPVLTWIAPLKADISGLLDWMKQTVYVPEPVADVDDVTFGKPAKKEKNTGQAG